MEEHFDGMHLPDPEKVLLATFEASNREPILEGRPLGFYLKSYFLVFGALSFRCLTESYFPSVAEIILALIISILSVLVLAASLNEMTRMVRWLAFQLRRW